jgi:hypothetical protein
MEFKKKGLKVEHKKLKMNDLSSIDKIFVLEVTKVAR